MKFAHYERAEEILAQAEHVAVKLDSCATWERQAYEAKLEQLHQEMRELWTTAMTEAGVIEPRKTLTQRIKEILHVR